MRNTLPGRSPAIASSVTKIWAGVTAVFNAVIAANPIVLVVLGILALIAVVVLAYNKFDWFRNFVDGVWQGIQAAVDSVISWFKSYVLPFFQFLVKAVVAYFKFMSMPIRIAIALIWAVVGWLTLTPLHRHIRRIGFQ